MQRRMLPRPMRYTTGEHPLVPPPALVPEPRETRRVTEQRRARALSPTRRLAAIAELHADAAGIGMCSACLVSWPCPTYTLAADEPPATDGTEGTEGGSVT